LCFYTIPPLTGDYHLCATDHNSEKGEKKKRHKREEKKRRKGKRRDCSLLVAATALVGWELRIPKVSGPKPEKKKANR